MNEPRTVRLSTWCAMATSLLLAFFMLQELNVHRLFGAIGWIAAAGFVLSSDRAFAYAEYYARRAVIHDAEAKGEGR